MIKQLIQLANHLDEKGLTKEAGYLDGVIRKIAQTNADAISKWISQLSRVAKDARIPSNPVHNKDYMILGNDLGLSESLYFGILNQAGKLKELRELIGGGKIKIY
jgi:hypothetical protein